ncbi:YuiB family protein [Marinicrinis lubricantis]|uniref:YuiB family protein n=1 Tax=Marinicrinis lubricantis TaxID=2086470 RepID=A0ABW1IUZ1_9BACL
MTAELLQLPILLVLFFVLLFGIGFILNMLLKTTWLTIYLYIFVMLPLVFYRLYDTDMSFWGNLKSYQIADYLTALGGLAGAYFSGSAIKTLREKGYKMF